MNRSEKQSSREPTPRSTQQSEGPPGDGTFRRNPRKRKRGPGIVPLSSLMSEAKLPRRFERAALAVIGRYGGTVIDFAGGILAVPQDEVEDQLDLLRMLSIYEQLRGCEVDAGLDFTRNPSGTQPKSGEDEHDEPDDRDDDDDDDCDDEEEEVDERAY